MQSYQGYHWSLYSLTSLSSSHLLLRQMNYSWIPLLWQRFQPSGSRCRTVICNLGEITYILNSRTEDFEVREEHFSTKGRKFPKKGAQKVGGPGPPGLNGAAGHASDTNLTSLAYGWVGLSVRHMKSSLDSSVFNDEENIPGGKPILIQLHFISIYSAESMSL